MTNTETTATKLSLYNVGSALIMATSEADAIAKIHGVAVANITDYPEINPGMTADKLEMHTAATLKV